MPAVAHTFCRVLSHCVVVACRTRKFASSRRRGGKLTKHLTCLGDDSPLLQCFKTSDGHMTTCLPPDFRNRTKVHKMIEVTKHAFMYMRMCD